MITPERKRSPIHLPDRACTRCRVTARPLRRVFFRLGTVGMQCRAVAVAVRVACQIRLRKLRFYKLQYPHAVTHWLNGLSSENHMLGLSYLETRALSAYIRSASRAENGRGGSADQPGMVETLEVEGLTYIRLTNVNGILAVYRVRTVNGKEVLKGMRHWPKELE